MLSQSEHRAALLAMTRFGVDQGAMHRACATVARAREDGKTLDLIAVLVRQHLLAPSQADDLRIAITLDATHLDLPPPGQLGAAASQRTPMPGDHVLRVLGDYRLLRQVGEGGMGAVYLAYDVVNAKKCAVKVLAEHLAGSQGLVDRFLGEGRRGVSLDHPNIVHSLASGRDHASGLYYLVMEYVDGPSAQALLEQFGNLAVGDAVLIVLHVARALEYLHSRNTIHRDIKPGNILITPTGVAKLSDLGLAKRTDVASHLTAIRQGFGTPYYMPYEQALNVRKADARSDIFALGATLYHLITGEVPFPGANALEIAERKSVGDFATASSVNRQVPAVLDRLLAKMLAREPADRHQSATELIVDLERADLAPLAPSFVDLDIALQDPLIRRRLSAPGQATRLDLAAANRTPLEPPSEATGDWWYLRYRTHKGLWCKARASSRQIRVRLRQGRLPIGTEASRKLQSGFQPLAAYAEFETIIRQHGQGNGAGWLRGPLGWVVGTGIVLAAAAALLASSAFILGRL